MLNYNKLFDVAYSNTLPEEVKASILDNVLEGIGAELNESLQEEDSHYVVLIDTLVNSTISEASLNDTLDMIFSNLSEEVINEVSDAYINRAAKNALKQRQATVKKQQDYGNRPIGLKGVERQAKEIDRAKHAEQMATFKQPNKPAQQAKPQAPSQSKPSAMDRLKSAVGKVKSWVDKVRNGDNNKPVGLSQLRQEKEERIKKAVEMGTGPKVEKKEAPKAAETTTTEAPKAEKKTTAKKATAKTASKKDKEFDKNMKKGDQIHKQVQDDIKKMDDEKKKREEEDKKAAEDRMKRFEELKKQAQEKVEKKTTAKKTTTAKKIAQAQKEAEKVEQPKEEVAITAKTPKKATATKKKTTTTTKKNLDATTKKVAAKVTTDKKKATTKTAKKAVKKSANEALAEFIFLMADTDVSESTMGEVVEMLSNAKLAKQAVERDYKEFSKAADALNKVEETKALTGASPVTPEQHKKMIENAAKKGERYERFKALADKKFG
jgi:hypothetical protein